LVRRLLCLTNELTRPEPHVVVLPGQADTNPELLRALCGECFAAETIERVNFNEEKEPLCTNCDGLVSLAHVIVRRGW
jgi:hypothetical protein